MAPNVHVFSRLSSSCPQYMYLTSVAAGFKGGMCGASSLRPGEVSKGHPRINRSAQYYKDKTERQ